VGGAVLSPARTGRRAAIATVDLVVAGGGPAGAAAAAAAGEAGLEVELVDAGSSTASPPGESLPPGTERILDQLFGPGVLRREEHRPAYENRSAWGDTALGGADFMLNPLGHGWQLDRPALDTALLASVAATGAKVVRHARVASQVWNGDQWEVELSAGRSERSLRARAVVDATGRVARIARSQGARRRRLDRLVAAYWLLDATEQGDGDSSTLIEAVEEGWWYTAPVGRTRRIVVLATDADLLPGRGARTATDWTERLRRCPHVADALSLTGCRLHGGPRITDAGTAHLDRSAGPGWVAVGDAAVSFDPLSSQGILTALLMGREAGRAVAAMLSRRDPEPLVRYGDRYAAILEDHLAQCAAYYGLERRWSGAPFWARRRRET
jgi:flavin-dependent dehydrogenase